MLNFGIQDKIDSLAVGSPNLTRSFNCTPGWCFSDARTASMPGS